MRAALVALSLCWGAVALADGRRELEDGIAFYENLDTERALDRLNAAIKSKDLSSNDRARAFLYVGLLRFELGEGARAERAWSSAFQLDLKVKVPDGTSPKAIAALEEIRKKIANTPPGGPKTEAPPPPPPPPVAPPPAVVPSPQNDEDGGISPWVWVGVGGAVVAGGAIALALILGGGSDSECPEGGGGCLRVDVRLP